MTNSISLGQFEQLVLTAVLTLGKNAYGVTIHARVAELSHPKRIALGAVYATLDRMEDKELVKSWLSDPTSVRGGRSKRHYQLENAGVRALRNATLTARRICDAAEQCLGEGAWTTVSKSKPAPQN